MSARLGTSSGTAGTPLLKWAGGKRRLLPQLLALIPEKRGRYFEPFFGGGAMFFSLKPRLATLSDANPELIACYREVRRNPLGVISHLRNLKNDEESYYRIREEVPTDSTKRAARFLYLTSLAFNGIYRQNLKGVFNVPYGHKTHLDLPRSLPILETAKALRTAKLQCGDFEVVVANAMRGDVIYFDPPYTVAHGNNGFVKYNSKIFSWDDQKRLSSVARSLANRGCTVIVSNADHASILDLYESFQVVRIQRQSVIAASSHFRGKTTECVFVRRGKACF
jgi:DNA adenine methylase